MAGGGGRSPFQISLRASERRALKRAAGSQAAPHRQVVRARIVLDAAAGLPSTLIARRVGVAPNTVRKWRKRFCTHGYAGLRDRPRSGRPRVFAAAVVTEDKAIACELPATRGVPLGRWSLAELRQEVIASGLVAEVSTATLGRWLAQDAIRPWQHRSWVFPRDPAFGVKAARVLDLYAGDLRRCQAGRGRVRHLGGREDLDPGALPLPPDPAPGRAQVMRVEHEYERRGALAYLAAWDVHRARLFGRCEPTTGIDPFGRLVAQVMTVEPYHSAKRVFWVVDNGSSHRGKTSVDRLEGQWPNLRLIHLPVHASWLNQIEIYFSVVQRKVVSPNDFTDLAEVEARLLAFQHRYEQTAVPFDWHFTRSDLDRLLHRLEENEQLARAA